jgi:hypothetical protein
VLLQQCERAARDRPKPLEIVGKNLRLTVELITLLS